MHLKNNIHRSSNIKALQLQELRQKTFKKNSLANAQQVTPDQTKEAFRISKPSKALGPNKISTLHLKHLGPKGISYLTEIFNISLKTRTIPAIWKSSVIIPLLKSKKPSEDSSSYRPVSLLCPAIKVLEGLILPTLMEHLPIPDIQHGFRKKPFNGDRDASPINRQWLQ